MALMVARTHFIRFVKELIGGGQVTIEIQAKVFEGAMTNVDVSIVGIKPNVGDGHRMSIEHG